MTDREFVSVVVGKDPKSGPKIVAAGQSLGMCPRSVYRYLHRAVGVGTVKKGGGAVLGERWDRLVGTHWLPVATFNPGTGAKTFYRLRIR
jgi:hypothetical protein